MLQKVDSMRQSTTRQLGKLKKWQKAWDIVATEQAASLPDAAVLKLQIEQLTGWVDAFPDHQADWHELALYITDRYQDLIRRYESELRRACAEAGYRIEGEFPNFIVDGLVKVSVNKEQNTARVNGKRTKSLSLPSLVDAIARERRRLWDEEFKPEIFFERLHVAYIAAAKVAGIVEGEYVPIRDTFKAMEETNSEYHLDSFSADVSQLIERRFFNQAGYSLDFAPVRDSRQAIYVYDRTTASGRYLGLLRFRKV